MLKEYLRRGTSLLLCALLLAGFLPRGLAAQEKPAVTLSSVEDLIRLGKNCALDSWSQGRTVRLTADLDLSGREFTPIPTFGGTFEGQGHTISGLFITSDGSSMGLFRFLQEGAVLRDLNVKGVVSPGGSAAQVGGIAGVNRGSIQSCTFDGAVQGESCVGGVAGLNRESGEIAGCSVSGQITGTSATGGVAGKNLGLLLRCGSSASVNTASPDTSRTLQDLASGVVAAPLPAEDSEQELDDLLASHSDTGGVAGLSSGVVQSCFNSGEVGYPHVGYNVGGVAGRQNGYLAGCTNSGSVYGRKDVGGVVGQAEPDVVLQPGSDTLDSLRRELDTLDGLIDRALDHTDTNSDRISQRLTAMGGYTDSARDHSRSLLDRASDFIDGNVTEINSLSAAVTAALDQISPALEDLSAASDRVDDLCGSLNSALDSLRRAGNIGQDAAEDAGTALSRLEQAGRALERASAALRSAVDRLQDAVIHKDPEAERQALADLAGALADLSTAFSQASQAASALLEALRNSLPLPDEDVAALTQALSDLSAAAQRAGSSLSVLSENISINWDALRDPLDSLRSALDDLRSGAGSLSSAMSALRQAADRVGDLHRPLGDAADAFRRAADHASALGDDLSRAFEDIGQALDTLREDGPVTLLPLGEEFREAGDGLYEAVSHLSDEMASLHGEIDSTRGSLSQDLRAISRQFGAVSDLLLDAVTDLRDGVQDPELVVDSSDQDIEGVRQGKITQCVNTGEVVGDRCVGGIAGNMSIEYDLDPEEDADRFSPGSTYETRAILLDNVNRGSISAKKDCVGGVVGRMDLGTAVRCQNYGGVESTGGSFTGGVAGWTESTVRSCCAKCVLSGEENVGGIAGWATKLYDCRAIVTITGSSQRAGAIAGDADLESGRISGNRFVDTGWGGIDGVSYEGLACPIQYNALREEPDIPLDFLTLTLTLRTEDEVVATLPLEFGQSLHGIALPQVPEREGFYGRWSDFEMASAVNDVTLEAVYTPWASLVASEEQSETGLALALAEGQFTEDARLYVLPGAQALPQELEGGEVWEVSLTGTQLHRDAQVPLRLFSPFKGGEVWQYQDGLWQKVDAAANGQYLLLTMDGLSAVYCVAPGQGSPLLWIGGGAVLLAAAALLLLVRRRKKAPAGAQSGASKP